MGKRGQEEIIVFSLTNATPAMLIAPESDDAQSRRRVSMCPDEWMESFGEEFYEHTLENSFFYLTPDTDWKAQAVSIPAPGIEQIIIPTPEELQMSIDLLMRGAGSDE